VDRCLWTLPSMRLSQFSEQRLDTKLSTRCWLWARYAWSKEVVLYWSQLPRLFRVDIIIQQSFDVRTMTSRMSRVNQIFEERAHRISAAASLNERHRCDFERLWW